jgi:hypothetical protein
MGSNDQFPPPPPPGQPPQPNWPPQQPGFPTQQVPTQAYPQQAYVPAVAAPKKGNGLLIGGGLVVVAALVGGVVLLTGGDDDKKSTITLAPITSSTLAPETTASNPVITLPPTTAGTDVPTTIEDNGLIEVTDDTGTFSMILPNDLELDTTTITTADTPPITIPSISAAEGIASYNTDDVTFGVTAISVGPDLGHNAEQVMAFLEPAEGTCTSRSVEIGRPTAVGAANVVSLSGCGVGAGNKVLMVVQLADRPVVIGIYMQGLAAIADLDPAAQYALESILVF